MPRVLPRNVVPKTPARNRVGGAFRAFLFEHGALQVTPPKSPCVESEKASEARKRKIRAICLLSEDKLRTRDECLRALAVSNRLPPSSGIARERLPYFGYHILAGLKRLSLSLPLCPSVPEFLDGPLLLAPSRCIRFTVKIKQQLAAGGVPATVKRKIQPDLFIREVFIHFPTSPHERQFKAGAQQALSPRRS